jgi:hypothetical protein
MVMVLAPKKKVPPVKETKPKKAPAAKPAAA